MTLTHVYYVFRVAIATIHYIMYININRSVIVSDAVLSKVNTRCMLTSVVSLTYRDHGRVHYPDNVGQSTLLRFPNLQIRWRHRSIWDRLQCCVPPAPCIDIISAGCVRQALAERGNTTSYHYVF